LIAEGQNKTSGEGKLDEESYGIRKEWRYQAEGEVVYNFWIGKGIMLIEILSAAVRP